MIQLSLIAARFLAGFAVAASICAPAAQAQHGEGGYVLAEKLADLCRANEGPDAARCETYIVGVTDSVMYDWAETVCIPPETTPAELKEVFIKAYVSDNSYHPAAIEIRSALQQKWPCKKPAAEVPRG